MRLFVGGSKTLKVLPEAMLSRLDGLIREDDEILIGDSKGADELVQRHLRQRRYDLVTVYAAEGEERCNLGNWDVRAIPCSKRKRRLGRYDNYVCHLEKDQAMALDADRALMVWNGRSKGTFLNILSMVALNKLVRVVLADSSAEYDVSSFEDVHGLLPARWPLHVPSEKPLTRTTIDRDGTVHDYPSALREFVPSKDMRAFLEEDPLSKGDLIDVVLGSPSPLEAKLSFFEAYSDTDDILHEVADRVASQLEKRPSFGDGERVSVPGFAWLYVQHASCSTHRDSIRKALKSLRSTGPDELVYRKACWDEQPVLYEEHEAGIAPFHTFTEALEDLRFEMAEEEWGEDVNCWTVFEKWRRTPSGIWENPYAFYAIGDEVVFFEEISYNESGRCWKVSDSTYGGDSTGRLNLRTPFKVGDIVTLDCRPFAPLEHGIILESDRESHTDCCLPWVMSRHRGKAGEIFWGGGAVKHGAGLYVISPGYSLLYRLETYEGPLPEDERILLEVQGWIGGDPERGKLLDEALRFDMTADEIRQFMAEQPGGEAKGPDQNDAERGSDE